MSTRTPQEIFRILVVHNKILGEMETDALMAQFEDPLDIIETLIAGELVSTRMGEKLRALYLRNLEKAGLAPEGSAAAAAATAVKTQGPEAGWPTKATRAEEAEPPAAAAPARAAPVPPSKGPAAPAEHGGEHAEGSLNILFERPAPATTADLELLSRLLKAARDVQASDLHITAGAVPVVRVHSALRELDAPAVPAQTCERMLMGILNEEQIKAFMDRCDLDFAYHAGETLGRFRVNYLRAFRGMDAVFRLISTRVPSFAELMLPEQIKRFTTYRQGVVLITGPKGSGKTTTMAALIDLINTNRAEHIITIEDPIEFVHPCKKGHVNQREVGPHTRSFAAALRSSLREAPDVIMVGEMRDLETTSLTITAAETGHLVFATLHTPDAPRTIGRVLDVFPAKEQGQIRAMFSESLRGIVSQQLVPAADGKSMHLAVEILFNNAAIGNLIRDNRAFQIKGIMQTGQKRGMMLMDDSLVKLVKEKKITKAEAMARADNPPRMEKDLTGVT